MLKRTVIFKNLLALALISLALAGCKKKAPVTSEASLPELDRALQSVAMAKGKFPEQVEDISEFLALQGKRIPTPLPGKKYVVDSTNRCVIVVSQ